MEITMKKMFIMLLAVILVCSSLTGCSKEEKSFTVGFDAEFPPYGYKADDGTYVGFDLDLAAEVCKRNNWTIKYQPIDWLAKDAELKSGTIDCIWNGFTMSEDRLEAYTWSEPYVDNSQVFVVATASNIKKQSDLAGKTVVVQASSSALEALESEESKALTDSFAELIQVPDYNTAFMYVESGMADACAMDIGVANYQIAQRESGKYAVLEEALVSEQYGIGFLLGNTELRDAVQKTLNEMAKDGTVAQIAEKWNLSEAVILGK